MRIAFGLASGQLAYQTADVPVSGNAAQTLALAAGGLLANTTYYYRATATNARGTATGAELTVTTKAAAPPAQGPKGDPGPAGPRGPAAPAPRAPVVKCTLSGKRTISCTFAARAGNNEGARARLSRGGKLIAGGVVRGRKLRMVAPRDVRAGNYVLKTTRGRGASAVVKRRAVKL